VFGGVHGGRIVACEWGQGKAARDWISFDRHPQSRRQTKPKLPSFSLGSDIAGLAADVPLSRETLHMDVIKLSTQGLPEEGIPIVLFNTALYPLGIPFN
jgi:hypothetical protein